MEDNHREVYIRLIMKQERIDAMGVDMCLLLHMYPGVRTIAAQRELQTALMRLLEAKGYDVHGIEYSEWVVSNFCRDFLEKPQRPRQVRFI